MTASAPAPSRTLGHLLIPLGAVLALMPFTSTAVALLVGTCLALAVGNPFQQMTRKWTHQLLALSVVGLGAGMDLRTVARAGLHGLGYTVLSISFTMALGLWLARRFRVNRVTGLLVTVGTAICGGSAIAAVAPVIQAEERDVSVALATVFMLNAVALFAFPPIGHALGLSQESFGLWAALAIHDTSSVVGAGMAYGPRALQLATTVKLARALWIVPVSLGVGAFWRRDAQSGQTARAKGKRPWFILGFVIAAALATYVPALHAPGQILARVGKQGLVLTLFLIGANLTRDAVRKVGARPFIMGVSLWLVILTVSLAAIRSHLIG
jgi:uncharacterized integral membrane protein (TIGR00698 family)